MTDRIPLKAFFTGANAVAVGEFIPGDTIPVSQGGTGATDAATARANLGISAGSGTVTAISVATANGLAGTVTTPNTTPAITLTTSVTGILKGNGTAISAAVSGTDLKTIGGTSIIGSGDIAVGGTGTVTSASVVTANGFAGTVATATTTPAITLTTSLTGLLKGNGTAMSVATAGTDYVVPSGKIAAVAGGAGGQVHYQSAVDVTSFLANGSANQVLKSQGGTAAPIWSTETWVAGGNVTYSGAFTFAGTITANTAVTFPVSGTLGYINIPQNSQSAAYTTVLADQGKHIYHPSADTTARTFTIDSNANVAYPVGTAITFVNDSSAGVVTIAITTDTLVLAGAGTTGSRTLVANGVATAIKITTTRWMISGTGLT